MINFDDSFNPTPTQSTSVSFRINKSILNEMEDGFEQKVAMDKEATLAMKR